MIAYLKGKLVKKEPSHVLVEVNGIGYQVQITLHTYSQIKDEENILLHTVQIIREDAHLLYGFSGQAEKQTFQQLIAVNGIGPGTAVMVLSSMSAEDLRKAILQEDIRTLQSVKGIGAKTAQRIILELKDKMKRDGQETTEDSKGSPYNTLRLEALSALTTLGIPRQAAEKSIDSILQKPGNSLSLEELVKLALKNA